MSIYTLMILVALFVVSFFWSKFGPEKSRFYPNLLWGTAWGTKMVNGQRFDDRTGRICAIVFVWVALSLAIWGGPQTGSTPALPPPPPIQAPGAVGQPPAKAQPDCAKPGDFGAVLSGKPNCPAGPPATQAGTATDKAKK